MTTDKAAMLYELQHEMEMERLGARPMVWNPHNKPIEELPVIYGWNSGGTLGTYRCLAMAEDGKVLASWGCSSSAYLPYDLGLITTGPPEQHEKFKEHYPDGFRCEVVPDDNVKTHKGLDAACKRNKEQEQLNG